MRFSTTSTSLALVLAIGTSVVVSLPAVGALATFDSLTEGSQTTTFIDGGVTFFDSIDFLGYSTIFVAERAEATITDLAFSPNNVIGQGGYSPGPGAGFHGVGTFRMTTGVVENFISVDAFTFGGSHIGNSLNLDILLGGFVVATTSVPITSSAITHHNLSFSGTNFDSARIYGSGSFQNGTVFARFDNVQIGPVPEPGTVSLVVLGCVGVLTGRRRQ